MTYVLDANAMLALLRQEAPSGEPLRVPSRSGRMGAETIQETSMAIEREQAVLTLEEFMALQEPEDESVRGYEYEEGRLIPMPPVYVPQSSAWGDLFGDLRQHVKQHKLGKVWLDVVVYLDPNGRRRYFPDIVYLANDRLDQRRGKIIVMRPEDDEGLPSYAPDRPRTYVYRRAGEPCRVCGTTIRTAELEGRNLFWCPTCQT